MEKCKCSCGKCPTNQSEYCYKCGDQLKEDYGLCSECKIELEYINNQLFSEDNDN